MGGKGSKESSLNKDKSLCVDKSGVLPYDLRFGNKVEKESCKERDYCKALTAAQLAQANPLGTKAKGGC